MRKTYKVLALIALFIFAFPTQSVQALFDDTAGFEYEESIDALADLGVINGYDDGSFRPEDPVNRAELLKIVFLGLEEEIAEEGNCFSDVNEEWFAAYVCHAKESEIVQGYSDNTFQPDQEVNMVEAFKIISESFDVVLRDLNEHESWYAAYADFMHINDLASKYAYFPERSATRGEVAYWVHQMMLIESDDRDIVTVRDPGTLGCAQNEPDVAPTSFLIDGEWRSTITVIPDHYDPNNPYPLIVAFHGRTSPNSEVQGYYGLDSNVGDDAIIVYPAGKESNGSFTWSDSGDSSGELRDYEFFDAIVDQFSEYYCVNKDEIYAVGHSLGAWFTNSLACARGDVLRAVGTLGGSRSESVCTGPTAAMQWHNPNDELAPYYTGLTARDYYIEQNNCSEDTAVVEPTWANCVEYLGCMEDATFLWCPHTNNYSDFSGDYYPHTWPRDTGKEIWNFFQSL
jgi:polyhydroxybutyrate depolymerase